MIQTTKEAATNRFAIICSIQQKSKVIQLTSYCIAMPLFRDKPSKEGLLVSHHDPLRSSTDCSMMMMGEEQRRSANVGGSDNNDRRSWTVARISVAMLLLVTFTNTACKIVSHQMHRIHVDSHDDYDALSMDVIRPAFIYQVASSSSADKKKPSNIGLGSAAISSITDALGPILPFTGGVDLRRSEYYTSGNVLDNLSSMIRNTYQAYANAQEIKSEEEEITTNYPKKKPPKQKKATKKKHVLPLSASQPFVSFDNIAELALEDVGRVFEYALKSTQEGFNGGKFVKGLLPRVQIVIKAMDEATEKSRGPAAKITKTTPDESHTGDMDAFMFCAAMRVFAEWRILRQVPEGYKGYAVGMSLGQKDVVSNVLKIERAAHEFIDYQLEESSPFVTSPTLRDLLEFETATGVNPDLPRLKETSGAMGLLWVRRQLKYQTHIFENILEVPSTYHSVTDAVSAAYTQTYDKYHGWAVQKIFSYSFSASPKVEEIYKFMNPHRLMEVKEIARNMKPIAQDETEPEISSDTDSDVPPISTEEEQPPENFFHRIGWEIEKFVNGIGQNLENLSNKSNDKKKKVRGGGQGSSVGGLSGDELEDFVCAEMSKNVHEHIVEYLKVAKPLLNDIAGLMDEMNMDDPTKV